MAAVTAEGTTGAPPRGALRLALIGSAALALAGGVAFYLASGAARHSAPAGAVTTISVTASGCEPASLTIPAGRSRFAIVNGSDRILEWEILDGVMVVAERENIAPGLTAEFAPRLEAGSYAITCGLLSNPRGTLVVTPSGEERAAPPELVAFVGPLAEMKVWLARNGKAFAAAAASLADAVRSGDLPAARAAYVEAAADYARIEATARRFGDLHSAIDGLAAYYERREADPAFSGLHRIEYGLFAENGIEGLAPIADRLVADAGRLADELAGLKPATDMLAGDAADYLTALGEAAPAGEERYAENDLADFSAALDGAGKTVALLDPLGERAAAERMATIRRQLADARGDLDRLRGGSALPAYGTVGAEERKALAADFAGLGASLAALNTDLRLQ